MGVLTILEASTKYKKQIYHPAVLHCNYVDDKRMTLTEGGWSLFQEDRQQCLSFNSENTSFAEFS